MTVLKNALAVNDGKAVVISIKREWLAKIMSGEKTLEVRKSRPWEISFPFAVFCYETKANGGAGETIESVAASQNPPCTVVRIE